MMAKFNVYFLVLVLLCIQYAELYYHFIFNGFQFFQKVLLFCIPWYICYFKDWCRQIVLYCHLFYWFQSIFINILALMPTTHNSSCYCMTPYTSIHAFCGTSLQKKTPIAVFLLLHDGPKIFIFPYHFVNILYGLFNGFSVNLGNKNCKKFGTIQTNYSQRDQDFVEKWDLICTGIR